MKGRGNNTAIQVQPGLYDHDFYAWTQRTARLLRAGRFERIDVENVAVEIEDMGKRDLKELHSRMEVLLMHLLKWRLQPRKQTRSWQTTILTQRLAIGYLVRQSPSLRPKLFSELSDVYRSAVKLAITETGLRPDRFPAQCPFTIEQILDEDFLPA